jgi:hypothetical protein
VNEVSWTIAATQSAPVVEDSITVTVNGQRISPQLQQGASKTQTVLRIPQALTYTYSVESTTKMVVRGQVVTIRGAGSGTIAAASGKVLLVIRDFRAGVKDNYPLILDEPSKYGLPSP